MIFVRICIGLLFNLLVGCDFVSVHDYHVWNHDVKKSIEVTNTFLKLNSSGAYNEAYKLFDNNFTDKVSFDSYKNDALNHNPNLGRLKNAEFKYYMVIDGQKDIELVYNCDFEKLSNIPLHFILSGTELDGYKITVIDIGYNYKIFGDDEDKRPQLMVGDGEDKRLQLTIDSAK
ncbi:MAG: hypothetical protein B7Y56_15855 [Gallionellales bacterium 35-53-114]|jgi:hypothetical protein|nr:MAG: hypothetical protein B7Y56_15855 [Gallionellales bacterium 35-53-114]